MLEIVPSTRAPVTRFAPSPTGRLHIGHAYSALFAAAAAAGGRFLLRIEDIDRGRCRPEFEAAILEDLDWLGLRWEMPVRRQSAHMADYRHALDVLEDAELLYPCFCTRKDLRAQAAGATLAPHGLDGPDGPLYPGICRVLSPSVRAQRIASGSAYALRLDMGAAAAQVGALHFRDRERGDIAVDPVRCGDVVLARKDVATSYHLAVTLDDAAQGVTLVTRGEDLLHATHIHRILQALLGLPEPEYWHHHLLRDAQGRRYAKRDRDQTIRDLRESGHSPEAVREMAGFAPA
jgi:glutamyl-Q tRNA(Asp) synthetase